MPSPGRLRAIASQLSPPVPAVAPPSLVPTETEEPVITAENWASWERDGYMVIKNILGEDTDSHCDAVQRDMMALLGWDLRDENTWYTYPAGAMRSGQGSDAPHGNGGGTMLNMWQTQSQWDNRQHPRIYKAFTEIWGTEALWCSIDCADCKPPARDDLPGWGHAGGIHCDVEQRMLLGGLAMDPPDASAINAPWGLRVQGNLYVDDTPQDAGGFRVVAGFHKNYSKWVEQQPKDQPLNFTLLDRPDDPDFPVINVGGQKGDFLLWHSFLPHSNGTNFQKKPRMCQYITMWPADLTCEYFTRPLGGTDTFHIVTDAFDWMLQIGPPTAQPVIRGIKPSCRPPRPRST